MSVRLENGERVEFDQIGSIYFDKNENILFDAIQKVNLRADAFGLDFFISRSSLTNTHPDH